MKRLVFCFDGTWNRLDAKCPTNVVITAESVVPMAPDGTAQLIFYDEGVGTGKWEHFRGGMFGAGLVKNMGDAYRFLIFNYSPGDQVYVFGFSRGAYTARSFAGLMSNCGVLLRKDAAKVTDAIKLYRARTNTTDYVEQSMRFRSEHSPLVCVSDQEDEWRVRNVPGYVAGSVPRLEVTYLGVWDTVGALGIPNHLRISRFFNTKHQFHDTSLSEFVRNARHAVAIDERRKPFRPTLWDNLEELNQQRGAAVEADDAPYQQKWFPGTHSSVGGGGERRGLSDQALEWVLDGASHAGMNVDTSEHSRIFDLAPDHTEYLENSEDPGATYRFMNKFMAADRQPGPGQLLEVSLSARRRWLDLPENLRDKTKYRPKTLARVDDDLKALDPEKLGVGKPISPDTDTGRYSVYEVERGDSLREIAARIYGDANEASRIFGANMHKLEDPDRIYIGQKLRIPLDEHKTEIVTTG